MARTLTITIPGRPVPKPRMTKRDKWTRPPRACVARYWAWADAARLAAKEAGGLPPASSISRITCTAFFDPPKSWPKKRQQACLGTPHRAAPDADNCLKAAGDSLFEDDRAIPDMAVSKRWGLPARMEITIEAEE